MVVALAVFLPLLGAFISVWLVRLKPSLSLAVSRLFLLGGLACTILLSIRLDAWSLTDLSRSVTLHTGLMAPPLSIDLRMTAFAVIASVGVYAGAILGIGRLNRRNTMTQPLLLSMVTASLGLMLATDLFNSFVFLEIGSIVTIGLTAACRCRRRWEVAVKVALISGLITILYLLAVLVTYRTTGELRLSVLSSMSGFPAILVSTLMLTVVMTEIKAFPLSGWGLDFYHGAGPGFAGVYSATWSLAILVWSARILPLLPLPGHQTLAWIGASGLLMGQLAGLRSKEPGRIMGYSTAAFASLLLVLAGVTEGNSYLSLALIMTLFASLSKFSIFLMADPGKDLPWKGVSGVLLLIPVLTVVGIPPLPVFWAKIRLLRELAARSPVIMILVLAGLFFEAVYLLRFWAGRTESRKGNGHGWAWMSTLLLITAGTLWITSGWWRVFSLSGVIFQSPLLRYSFMAIFAAGTLTCLPGALGRSRSKGDESGKGYWLWLVISGALLTLLPASGNGITFYVLWEMSAFAAVVAVSRSGSPVRGSFRSGTFWFSVFAMASGLLLLASLVISGGMITSPGIPMVLTVLAAMLKMGQMGSHLWTVRAYSEAPGTVPAFLSGTSSKAAVLLLVAAFLSSAAQAGSIGHVLVWTGALTALGMAFMASLESDYKRVLAYASVSQLGYLLVGLGTVSIMGWTAAFYHTVHHFLFKTVLFLGAAGVIVRTGTSDYNGLGGLIRRMPLTFTFTLISVIAFAGVPPLAGFGGKWLLYNALIEAGMLPAALIAMFASVVAFLYAFRLLYAVFLGQLSEKHSQVGEAPLKLLVPQGILTAAIMVLSFRPTLLLERLVPAVERIQGLTGLGPNVSGTTVTALTGSWDAWSTGIMVCILFGLAFVLYWISGRRPKHVGQLDIGFAGELPASPEEVHYSGTFYRPFRRALGFLPRIHAGRIHSGAVRLVNSVGDGVRSLFTGDARTYLAHVLVFVLILLFWIQGGVPW